MQQRSTMQLLHMALAQDPNTSFWAEQLGLNRTALVKARIRGRLSPTTAGNLARLLGENIEKWMLVATFEAEPDTPALQTLKSVTKVLNS